MMPVISPETGGAPDAIAMPIQSGSATRNTTIEARKSLEIELFLLIFSFNDATSQAGRPCRTGAGTGRSEIRYPGLQGYCNVRLFVKE